MKAQLERSRLSMGKYFCDASESLLFLIDNLLLKLLRVKNKNEAEAIAENRANRPGVIHMWSSMRQAIMLINDGSETEKIFTSSYFYCIIFYYERFFILIHLIIVGSFFVTKSSIYYRRFLNA